MERSSRRRNLTYFSEGAVRKRHDGDVSGQTTLEALDMEPSANETKPPLTCLPCHYTCATCVGPHNNQCSSCLDDARLFNETDTEPKFYCYPNTVVSQINAANWHYRLNIALAAVLLFVTCVSLYLVFSCLIKRWCRNSGHYNSNVAYNKLAVDEKQQSALEIEEEIHKAIKYLSESESEDDDLNL